MAADYVANGGSGGNHRSGCLGYAPDKAIGHRAESYEHFSEIMDTSLNSKGVHVIDLPIDYSLNHSILNVLIQESACIV